MASITGITDADVTQVRIDHALGMEEFEAKNPDDASIRSALAASFELSHAVPNTVQSRVENGFVTITGTVAEISTKKLIGQLARQTVGVSQIFNEIEVTGPSSKTDGGVSENVYAKLTGDPQLRAVEIFPICENGTCTLRGLVFSQAQRDRATVLIAHMPLISKVNNNITIEGAVGELSTRTLSTPSVAALGE